LKTSAFSNTKNWYISSLSLITIILIGVFGSCTTENEPEADPTETAVTIQADNQWVEDSLLTSQVKWYHITGTETFTTLYIEWAEADFHGTSKSYSSDIQVSAYHLDGERAYFENQNTGYGTEALSISLDSEKEVLLKVELNDAARPGTYAIRSTGTGPVNLEYTDLPVQDIWFTDSIETGQVKGYLVDCGEVSEVEIIWAEVDSPESGYTAEIMGSVFHLDGETPYQILDNGKDFLVKNNSHSDNPKAVEVNATEKKIKIHIEVNSLQGTYAIKVIPKPVK